MMSISSRIKEAREKVGLSRAELAHEIGISASSISNYENGISSPKDSILYALMIALHVDANYIFQDEMNEISKTKNSPTPIQAEVEELTYAEKHLIRNLRSLNNDGQEKLLDYSDDLIASGRYIIDNSISNMA